LEDLDKNLKNPKKNNLQKIHKINLHLKINSLVLLSPTLHQITRLTMDSTCNSKDAKILLKDP